MTLLKAAILLLAAVGCARRMPAASTGAIELAIQEPVTGAPAQAQVRLALEASVDWSSPLVTQMTDSVGRVSLKELAPGKYRMSIRSFGHFNMEQIVEVRAGRSWSGRCELTRYFIHARIPPADKLRCTPAA